MVPTFMRFGVCYSYKTFLFVLQVCVLYCRCDFYFCYMAQRFVAEHQRSSLRPSAVVTGGEAPPTTASTGHTELLHLEQISRFPAKQLKKTIGSVEGLI